jgi:hypothetical protein
MESFPFEKHSICSDEERYRCEKTFHEDYEQENREIGCTSYAYFSKKKLKRISFNSQTPDRHRDYCTVASAWIERAPWSQYLLLKYASPGT